MIQPWLQRARHVVDEPARIDDAIRAAWLRIDGFWPLGLGVTDQKLVDLEECLHVAACEVDYALVVRVLAAYEARARDLTRSFRVANPWRDTATGE
jgi:hypothetical protein